MRACNGCAPGHRCLPAHPGSPEAGAQLARFRPGHWCRVGSRDRDCRGVAHRSSRGQGPLHPRAFAARQPLCEGHRSPPWPVTASPGRGRAGRRAARCREDRRARRATAQDGATDSGGALPTVGSYGHRGADPGAAARCSPRCPRGRPLASRADGRKRLSGRAARPVHSPDRAHSRRGGLLRCDDQRAAV